MGLCRDYVGYIGQNWRFREPAATAEPRSDHPQRSGLSVTEGETVLM